MLGTLLVGAAAHEPPAKPHGLKEREQEILKILGAGEHLSVRDIANRLQNAPANRTIGDDLAHLKTIGLVNSEGIGAGSKWFISTK